MKIVALSDTHSHHMKVTVPVGDVLVFAGDFMTCGRKFSQVRYFAEWFQSLPHKYKILVAGNHDRLMQSDEKKCLREFANLCSGNCYYLKDSSCIIEGVKFWGSPYTPEFCNWAFDYQRGQGYTHWDKIPNDTNVLITHGPVYGVLDQMIPGCVERPVGYPANFSHPAEHLGCPELKVAIERVKPKVHIFGHIHGSYGSATTYYGQEQKIISLNASICNEKYEPINEPHVIEV